MNKTILVVISILFIAVIASYTWLNRDSDRVVLTFATAVLLSALGFITKELISNKEETFEKEFPVVTFYSLPNFRPVNIDLPYLFDLQFATQNIDPKYIPPNNQQNIDIEFGSDIYFDALTYSVIHTLFKNFSNGWNLKTSRINTPHGQYVSNNWTNEKGKEIEIADFVDTHIPNNYFFKIGLLKDRPKPLGGKAIFPPGTKISTKINDKHNRLSIFFNNKYLSFALKIHESNSSIGIGEYSRSFGFPERFISASDSEHNKVGTSVYIIEISGKQNTLLNGHPEMKKHRKWADSIIESLETTYSYNLIRENHIRSIQIYGHESIKGL